MGTNYLAHVWVRGYGLIDSEKVQTAPGKTLNLNAVVAPSPAAAAEYYPAVYWYSMLKVPEKDHLNILLLTRIKPALTDNRYLTAIRTTILDPSSAKGATRCSDIF